MGAKVGSGLSGSLWLMVPVSLMPGASSFSDIFKYARV